MTSIRFFPYIISQYFWVVIICLPLLYYAFPRSNVQTKEFSSITNYKFNESFIPSWFLHGTDLHVNSIGNSSYLSILKQLNDSINLFKPKKILLTGDLVDNRNPTGKRPFTTMVKKDWDTYSEILEKLNLTNDPRLIQIAGNHDFYDLLRYTSSQHYGNGIIYNESTFQLNRKSLDMDGVKSSILAINPYNFPVPVLRMTWFTSPKNEVLKNVENAISENTDDIQILLQHHPSRMWFPNTFTKNNYLNFLKTTKNVRLILCGHRHPKDPVISHFGDVLEVVGTPWFRYPKKVGLISYDNRRISYHEVDISKGHAAIMTYPTPDSQISSLDDFSQNQFSIRAISFGKKSTNLSVSGDVNGTLSCDKEIEKNVYLCHFSVNLKDGKYFVEKTGDWSGNITFTVGKTIQSMEESNYLSEHSISYIFFSVYFILIFIVFFFVFFVFQSKAESAEQWITGNENNSHWLLSLCCGFLIVNSRIWKSPLFIRYFYLVLIFWPVLLPIDFFLIESRLSMIWIFGFLSNKAILCFEGCFFALKYVLFVTIPFILMNSAISAGNCKSYFHIVEVLAYLACLCYALYTCYLSWDWFGLGSALTSPCFLILPILSLVFTSRYEIKELLNPKATYDTI